MFSDRIVTLLLSTVLVSRPMRRILLNVFVFYWLELTINRPILGRSLPWSRDREWEMKEKKG